MGRAQTCAHAHHSHLLVGLALSSDLQAMLPVDA